MQIPNAAHRTRMAYARVAGLMFLLYIVVDMAGPALFGVGTNGSGTAARLAGMAQHAGNVRIDAALGLLTGFIAVILAVALYAITRERDLNLATLGLLCRVGEGLVGSLSIPLTLGLLSLATANGANAPDGPATQAMAAFIFAARDWYPTLSAMFFAVGSLCFAWILLRGRLIPVLWAWLGLIASILLVVCLPVQLAGFLPDSLGTLIWIPMAVFEIPLGVWMLIKGVNPMPTEGSLAQPG